MNLKALKNKEIFKMEKQQFKERYWIRVLYGFKMYDIYQTDDLKDAINQFELSKEHIIKEKKTNTPFMIMLVDSKTEKIIDEYTETPTEKH